ncbi:hypothetical protein CCP2SC5_60006 [Azospirillaceae bacterium]
MAMLSVAQALVRALRAASAVVSAEPEREPFSAEPELMVMASASAEALEQAQARRARLAATSATTPRSARSTSIRNWKNSAAF